MTDLRNLRLEMSPVAAAAVVARKVIGKRMNRVHR